MTTNPSPEQLKTHHCVPCEGGVAPLTRAEFGVYLPQVNDWSVENEDKQLKKEFVCKNFSAAVSFIQEIAKVAEEEGHHPDLYLYDYKKLRVTLSTHAIGGLSVNDFVLAVKIDEVWAKMLSGQ